MYWRDHGPPHFHAEYGDHEALIVIGDGRVFAGSLRPPALRLVRERHRLHTDEVRYAWGRVSRREDPGTIEPLAMKMLKKIPKLTTVEVLPPYGLRVTFDDGVVREVDLADELWGPMFEPLRDPAYFAQANIDHGTVAWPNGLDLDPLVLHGDLAPADRGVRPSAG